LKMNKLSNENIVEKLKNRFGTWILDVSEPYGLLTITIPKETNVELISWLAKDKEMGFNFLTDVTAVHYPENEGSELCIVYHLHSFIHNIRLRIKLFLDKNNPEVQSLTAVYSSANWMERETYDFYGIQFQDHPNLKRILNMDEMDYFPMQKQYPLEDQQRKDKEDKFFGR
jgi:NADH-quinone oxidoreductase subunit C